MFAAFAAKLNNAYYESAIILFFKKVLNKIKEIYYASFTAKVIGSVVLWMKRIVSYSKIWTFVKRRDYLSKIWTNSIIFRFADAVLNGISKAVRAVYSKIENYMESSLFILVLRAILKKFDVLLGITLGFILVVPYNFWHNEYGVILVGVLFIALFLKTVLFKGQQFELKSLDPILVVFIITIILATATSVVPMESLSSLILFMTCFLLILVIVSGIRTTADLSRLLKIFLTAVTFTGLYGIWQRIIGIPIDPTTVDTSINIGMQGRVYSTMHDSNTYAEILLLSLPFYAAVILNSKTFTGKLCYGLMAVPVLLALIFTGTRSAWIAFAIAVFVFLFFKNRKLIPLIIIAAVAAFPFLPLISPSFYNRITTIWNPNDTSIGYRGLIYRTVKPMLEDNWFTGVGLGSDAFMQICSRYPLYTNGVVPPHSHNLFLEIWLEAGIISILSFVWFMARMVKKCMITIFEKTDKELNHILMSGVAAMAGISVMGLAEYVWFEGRVMLFFWAVAGFILAALGIAAKEHRLDRTIG